MRKDKSLKTLEKEAFFWNGIKKALVKNRTKICHK